MNFFKKYKKTLLLFLFLVFSLGVILALLLLKEKIIEHKKQKEEEKLISEQTIEEYRETRKHFVPSEDPPLSAPSMEIIKKKGCVADGILFGYEGKDNTALKMINRSECQYLHRAVETWLSPPDFEKVAERKKQIIKDNMVYGMFIAEAIDKKANYYYPDEDRDFKFSEMCRPGSNNFWGEHTCKPSFARKEYRNYVQYIVERAIDNDIQVFMFGQIFFQEGSDLSKPWVKEIIESMREYAAFKGTSILVGAQTNDIVDENYLRLFDFIEGGVGLSSEGTIENSPCFSRWWSEENGGWCWALLWNEKYKSKANNVLLHLDWSGAWGDDMSTFARMSKEKRAETLKYLHNYFTSRGDGFILPMIAVLHKENGGGCYGDKAKYYSADNKFNCQDEDVINQILKQVKINNE